MSDFDRMLFGRTGRLDLGLGLERKKKRAKLTPAQRLYIWEHPKLYGRTCHICHQRITKMSELELDHRRAFRSGGSKLFLAHKECNRMKGSKGLGYVQRKMGIKSSRRKIVKRRRRRRVQNVFGFEVPDIRI